MPFGTAPRIAKLNPDTQILWSDGSEFNGFVRFGLVVPRIGGNDVTQLDSAAVFPGEQIPLNTMVPILDGRFSQFVGLFYNADISPPNSQYVIWYYDLSGNLIAGPSVQFVISQNHPALPAATLNVPTVGSTIPPSE